MTRDETKKLIALITSTYPAFRPDNLSMTVDVWSKLLEGDSNMDMQQAFFVYCRQNTTGFAPSVGQLLDIVTRMHTKEPEMSEGEVWSMVYGAICNSNYHSKECFDGLPEDVQSAIGSHNVLKEWACSSVEDLEVIRSNFMRSYRAVSERRKEMLRLPEKYREMLSGAVKMIGRRNEKADRIAAYDNPDDRDGICE